MKYTELNEKFFKESGLYFKDNRIDKIVKKKAPHGYKKIGSHDLIWRGAKHVKITKPTVFTPNRTNKNFYNTFLAGSPDWKKYPSRVTGFICSTSKNEASSYSSTRLFVIMPISPNTKIGVAPRRDMWQTPNNKKYNIPLFPNIGSVLDELIEYINLRGTINLRWNSIEEFRNELYRLNELIKTEKNKKPKKRFLFLKKKKINLSFKHYSMNHKRIIDDLIKADNLVTKLDEIMSPEQYGFKAIKFKDYDLNKIHAYHKVKELWIDEPCLFIPIHLFKSGVIKEN